MKISLAWLRDYVDLPADLPIARIMHDLTMTTVEVEGAHDLSAALAHVVVGRIESIEPSSADPHWFAVRVAVAADASAPGAIVNAASNATNLKPGLLVAVALPGASLQISQKGKKTTREVAAATIRGIATDGVICTVQNLQLEGLFQGDESSVLDLRDVKGTPGQTLAEAIGFDDTVLEIDNKSLTNRPDLWSHYGIAREFAAIYKRELRPLPATATEWPAADYVTIEAKTCNRMSLMKLVDVKTEPAPFWMQSRLAKLDQRPINLWVDLTNYIMFAVGQPCHAYDSAKLALPLRIHDAKDGDALDLLDGNRYPLDASTLVISDRDAIVDLAGIMGGKSSAVSGSTTELLFEAGNFDAHSIRRSSARMGLRTEASARFEKALDTQRVDAGQAMFVTLLKEIQPSAKIVGFQDLQPAPTQRAQVSATVDFFRDRLGAVLDANEIADQLALLGFDLAIEDGGKLVHATAPTWRSTGDISIPNDLLEEVARIRGYDNFELVPPTIELLHQTVGPRTTLQSRIRAVLALNGGMQEVVTYPWVHDSFLDAMGMSAVPRLRLAVQPGENQGSLRPSLLPNLLEAVAKNVTLTPQFRIFELGRIFLTDDVRGDAPEEVLKANPKHLAGAFVGPDAALLFSQAKGMLETLRRVTHVASLTFGSGTAGANGTPPAWADASGRLSIEANGKTIGFLGLVTKKARRVAGIKRSEIAMFELNVDLLEPLPSRENRYRRLPEQPESEYDVSMLFANEVTWQSITGALGSGHPLIRDVQFVDEYRGAGVAAGQKSITIRLRIGADDKTLTSKEINDAATRAVDSLKQGLGGELRVS